MDFILVYSQILQCLWLCCFKPAASFMWVLSPVDVCLDSHRCTQHLWILNRTIFTRLVFKELKVFTVLAASQIPSDYKSNIQLLNFSCCEALLPSLRGWKQS